MGFLRSGKKHICFKFEGNVIFIPTLLKFELERDVVFFSGSAAEGAALSNPPTPRNEGSGVGVNKKACVRS